MRILHFLNQYSEIIERDSGKLLFIGNKCSNLRVNYIKALPFHINVISSAARGKLRETAHSMILHDLLHHPLLLSSFLEDILGIAGDIFSPGDIRYPDRDRIDVVHPKTLLFGHIHLSHGLLKKGNIIYSNGAIMNDNFTDINTFNLIKILFMDATAQLKRHLWVMKEIMEAYPYGITLDKLKSKWGSSYMNEDPGRELNERTFLRIRRTLENIFGITIECNRLDGGSYNLSPEDAEPGANSLLSLIHRKNENKKEEIENRSSSLNDIFSLLLDRGPIPENETAILGEIHTNIKKIPLEVQEEFRKLIRTNKIKGADSEAPDRFYKPDYLDVWNAERYQKIGLWLYLGFLENEIRFYVLTQDHGSEMIKRIASELNLDEGIKYRGRWWWFEPKDKDLFCLKYEIRPKMTEIVS